MRLDVPPAPFYPGSEFFASYDIPLRVIHVENSPAFPVHRHDFTELIVAYSGKGRHIVNGVEYAIGQGDVFVIPRGSAHEYRDLDDLCYINVIFNERAIIDESLYALAPRSRLLSIAADERSAAPHARLSVFGLREAIGIINRIDQELFRRDGGYAFMAESYFMQLWGTLARESADRRDEGESSSSRIARIARVLARDPSADVSVADMAAEAGTSERNFRRAFKKETGNAPLAYVNEARVRAACELLSASDRTVTQIAALVGYEDSNYFARQFKRIVGCSPREFRDKGSFTPKPFNGERLPEGGPTPRRALRR